MIRKYYELFYVVRVFILILFLLEREKREGDTDRQADTKRARQTKVAADAERNN